jgi:hypothetical protein
MEIGWEGMGRALRNPLHISSEEEKIVEIKRLDNVQ